MRTLAKTIKAPNGSRVKVSITAEGPITEKEFPILRDTILADMGACLESVAEALKPKDK